MQRRKFSREFKIEAVRLVRERGVSVARARSELGAAVEFASGGDDATPSSPA